MTRDEYNHVPEFRESTGFSPMCPLCGSNDPNVRLLGWKCRDSFHDHPIARPEPKNPPKEVDEDSQSVDVPSDSSIPEPDNHPDQMEQEIAIEVGVVHKAASEGRDETVKSCQNINALIARRLDAALSRVEGELEPCDHEPMCDSDGGEEPDKCDCWKSLLRATLAEIRREML